MSWERPAIKLHLSTNTGSLPQARLDGLLRARLARSQRRGDETTAARTRRMLANLQGQLGSVSDALGLFEQALASHRQAQQWLACADVLLAYAEFLRTLRRGTQASESLHQARGLYLREKEPLGLALTEVVQAGVHLDGGRLKEALACLQRAGQGATLFGLPEMAAPIWWQIASLHNLRQEPTLMQVALRAAVSAYAMVPMPQQACELRLFLSQAFLSQGMLEDLDAWLDLAEAEAEAAGSVRLSVMVELERSALHLARGKANKALRSMRRALRILQDAKAQELDLEFFLVVSLGEHCASSREGLAEAELLLGRAFDLALMQKDYDTAWRLASDLMRLGQAHQEENLTRRWRTRVQELSQRIQRSSRT